MFTTDLSLRFDPIYGPISKRFHENPGAFAEAFAKAWYKLTHRDMGPRKRLLGSYIPAEQIWQDPVPEGNANLSESDVSDLKQKILSGSGLSVPQLVRTAWASACTFRCTDYRGGANGARIRLGPQKDWAANDPAELSAALSACLTLCCFLALWQLNCCLPMLIHKRVVRLYTTRACYPTCLTLMSADFTV